MKNIITKIFCAGLLIILLAPFKVFAINDVQINGSINFELNTADTAIGTTIITTATGQVTNFDVHSNYIDITLDNASAVTFNTTIGGQYFRVIKNSGSNDYTINPTCPTTTVALGGTGANVVLRLEIITTNSCNTSEGASSGGGGGGGGADGATYYIITASAGENGSISPAGAMAVTSGGSQIYTITPATGYQVADVLVDGTSIGAVTTYTFSNIATIHTISANFSAVVAPAPVCKFADINCDVLIDELDLSVLVSQWRQTGPGLSADIDGNEIVDELDFALLMDNWGL